MARFVCTFISYSLMRTVDLTLIVPTPTLADMMEAGDTSNEIVRHTPKEKYPVLYLLHGIGNNHTAWTSYTNIERYAEERSIAVVMFSAENKFYVDKPGGDQFFQFLNDELPDFVCGMFPISRCPKDTFIAGLSMGGYGTLLHIFSAPEHYAAAGAFSSAIHIDPRSIDEIERDATRPPEYDPLALAAAAVNAGKHLPALYLSCGEADFLFADNILFRDQLRAAGVEFEWRQEPEVGHEWQFWDRQVKQFLDWIPRTDFYSSKRRKC